ncbi:MAG: DUF1674 domain-containing protein [Rhodospirillales bacterium]|nr:MAG: DUF1674 domain-containing protein [Rhodospirillales bacterium]
MSDETSGAKPSAPDPEPAAGRLKTHVVAPKPAPAAAKPAAPAAPAAKVEEIGGPPGPEPTRYGDWQYGGKVTDF